MLAAAVVVPELELGPVKDVPDPVTEELGEVAVEEAAGVPDGGTTPEGMETIAVVDTEAVALVVGALEGSPVTGTPCGRLMLVVGSVVWCGGKVFELDAALTCVDADADADAYASVPMIVKGALMLPEEPNTAILCANLSQSWLAPTE